jgi:C4-dicarboxylate-specific signal transduction histidine kinase
MYLIVNILLIATIGFFRLVKSTVKPVERLVRMTEEYDEKNDFLLFPSKEGNEFGQLSSSLNRMIRRIDNDRKRLRDTVASLEEANTKLRQTQDEMIRAEKLASIGRLSAGLAHEIGNPIGIIQGYLELLQRQSLSDDDRLQFAQRAASELNRINQLIRQLLDFARSSPSGRQQLHINEQLQDILDLFKARNKMDHIHFHLNLQTHNDIIETSEEGLRQVLLNCLLNAVDAIEEKGKDHQGEIVITSHDETGDDLQPSIAITIQDNGCGIDTSRLTTIFDPFFTTKEPGKGTGLGLSVSHTIIESLGGQISVQSEPGSGTEIKIILPRLGEVAS